MHVVKYTESEAGWGGEVWFASFNTYTKALEAVKECNIGYDSSKPTPSYYILASYEGEMTSLPNGYKI